MVYGNEHHIIPMGRAQVVIGNQTHALPSPGGAPGTGAVAGNTTTQMLQHSSSTVSHNLYILFISLGVLLLLSIILYLNISRIPPRGRRLTTAAKGAASFLALYRYEGLRRKLRQIFIEVRSAAEKIRGASLKSKTALEIAREISVGRDWAETYSLLMYSRREPTPQDVEGLEYKVKEVVRKWEHGNGVGPSGP